MTKQLAIVIPWFGADLKGGAEQLAWQVATRLAARGHRIDVLTTCCKSFLENWETNHFRPGRYREQGVTITVIKLTLLIDHYVAVFEVTADDVVFGDPLRGKRTLTHDKFLKEWRYTGIVVKRRG